MTSVRTVHRLPAISRSSLVTTGGANPLPGFAASRSSANAGHVAAVVDEGGGGGGGGGDRRTLLGVGTYLIDTPKDSGLHLRQRYFHFQEQHRGQVARPQDEVLPDIPYRLNPKPGTSHTGTSTTGPPSVCMVDAATSPIFFHGDDDDDYYHLGPSRSASPDQDPNTQGVISESETSEGKDTNDVIVNPPPHDVIVEPRLKTVSVVVKKTSQGTSMSLAMARSVSFSERPRRKTPPRRPVRECSKVNFYAREASNLGNVAAANTNTHHSHNSHQRRALESSCLRRKEEDVAERTPDTARTHQTLDSSRKKSASASDLTDAGSIFSWHDKDFELKTSRSVDVSAENVGPTSFFQRSKSKSLLDLLRPALGGWGGEENGHDEEGKAADLSAAYHKRLRIAHLAFRRENSLARSRGLSRSVDASDKEWMDMVNTQVVDNNYDRYASRRKPVTPFVEKKPSKPFTTPADFRLSHPASGKMYPVFFNDGTPPRKFGRALYKRRVSKTSSK